MTYVTLLLTALAPAEDLGPKFGKQIGTIRTILAELNGNEAMDEINATGQLKINIDGSEAVLEKDDLLIEAAQTEGFISDSDHGITVVLDTNLTEDLIEEGFVNEIISKIQTMRKEANFEVMDQIRVSQSGNDKIKEIILRNAEEIKTQVLAKELVTDTVQGFVKEWNVNGEEVTLSVEKL
jgi:isoleucyl-tRNA synthetase